MTAVSAAYSLPFPNTCDKKSKVLRVNNPCAKCGISFKANEWVIRQLSNDQHYHQSCAKPQERKGSDTRAIRAGKQLVVSSPTKTLVSDSARSSAIGIFLPTSENVGGLSKVFPSHPNDPECKSFRGELEGSQSTDWWINPYIKMRDEQKCGSVSSLKRLQTQLAHYDFYAVILQNAILNLVLQKSVVTPAIIMNIFVDIITRHDKLAEADLIFGSYLANSSLEKTDPLYQTLCSLLVLFVGKKLLYGEVGEVSFPGQGDPIDLEKLACLNRTDWRQVFPGSELQTNPYGQVVKMGTGLAEAMEGIHDCLPPFDAAVEFIINELKPTSPLDVILLIATFIKAWGIKKSQAYAEMLLGAYLYKSNLSRLHPDYRELCSLFVQYTRNPVDFIEHFKLSGITIDPKKIGAIGEMMVHANLPAFVIDRF